MKFNESWISNNIIDDIVGDDGSEGSGEVGPSPTQPSTKETTNPSVTETTDGNSGSSSSSDLIECNDDNKGHCEYAKPIIYYNMIISL